MTPPHLRSPERGFSFRLAALAVIVAALFVGYYLLWSPQRNSLVIYCAHDSIYADQILREFERQTGIPIAVRYDTEATQVFGTGRIAVAGEASPALRCLLEQRTARHASTDGRGHAVAVSGKRLRANSRSFQGRGCPAWGGFAARLRLWMVNTNRMPPTRSSHSTGIKR